MLTGDPSSQPLYRVGDPWASGVRASFVAMASGTVLLADGASLHVGSVADGGPARRLVEFAHPVGGLSVSASGRFGLVRERRHNRVTVVDLVDGSSALSFGASDGRSYSAVAEFGTLDGHDVLYVCRTPYTLDVVSLPDGGLIGSALYRTATPFEFTSIHPVGEEFVVTLGSGVSEGYLALLTVSVPELLADPSAAGTEFRRRRWPFDYVHALSAGPCGTDSVVAHRDPLIDDDEVPEPDEDEEEEPNDDIEDLHGFYVRRLGDNALLDRIPYDGTVPDGSPMFGTDAVIVVGLRDRVAAFARSAAAVPTAEVEARVYGFDVAAQGIVVARSDGTVDMFRAVGGVGG